MYSYSGSNMVQCDSSPSIQGMRDTFGPVKFLEMKRSDIIDQLRNMEYSKEEAFALYSFMMVMISKLKPLRASISETYDYIDETVREIPRRAKSITISFLLQAITGYKTYNHAYNCLVHHATRCLPYPVNSIIIPEYEILAQIELENEAENIKLAAIKLQSAEDQTKFIPFESFQTDNILSDIRNSENHFWKGLPMNKVVDHFILMTTRKNRNGEPYLTNEQLISFLRKGFLNDAAQPQHKINCTANEKGFVIKRFYQLYDLSVAQYCHPAKKEKFINLFTDCFDNWDKESVAALFKPNKVKDSNNSGLLF
jgi:hypothetical protein